MEISLEQDQYQLLLAVVEWYADPANWVAVQNPILSAMYPLTPAAAHVDGGERAREALGS